MMEDIYAVEFHLTGDRDFMDVKEIVRSERVIGFQKTIADYEDRFYALADNAGSIKQDLSGQGVKYETTGHSRDQFDSWYSDLVESEDVTSRAVAD